MKNFKGHCDCGVIEFSFKDEPINTVFCYCKSCQLHTGSDKFFGVWVARDKFQFDKGTPASFTRQGDSGEKVIHLFCDQCNTTLCADITVANFYSVAATTIEHNDNLAPKMAIYSASAAKWAVFPEGIPKFDQLPPELST